MFIFDAHSDILVDITVKRQNGERDVFRKYHYEKLKRGGIGGLIAVIWIDKMNMDPLDRMNEIINEGLKELKDIKDIAEIVLKYEDFERIRQEGKMQIVLGCEGLSGIKGDIHYLDLLFEIGIRHASLTWNEENELGTGVKGDPKRGLTRLGQVAVKKLEELGILIDVSHANEKTFWDICEITTGPIIASHSNAYSLCPHPRNLKDDQIKAIAEKGGVIGINAWPDFVDEFNATIEGFIEHIDYMVEKAGIDHVALGFDFCDFLSFDATSSFSEENKATKGLEDASKSKDVIDLLLKRGYKHEDIEKITYKNIEKVFKLSIS
jgi:membrane dipeptidase